MIFQAKNSFLKNHNGDSITFRINKARQTAKIRYYYKWGNTKENITCSIADADDRFDSAIKAGYEVQEWKYF